MAVLTSRVGKLIAGKVGYGVTCLFAVAVLVVSGYAYKVVGLVSSTGQGIAINGSPVVGAMNILVMGLESRTDYYGNTLPNSLLTAMHAGNASAVAAGHVGAQDTNTLILIHIFAGGQKAAGFSIPRDDLVNYPHATYLGITRGKIDQAYDFAYNQSLGQTYGSSMSHNERYLKANQAGQAFEIATVEAVTGVHVDHFAEVNLAGFYYLAQAFGGIEVCIKPAPAQGGLPAGANLTDKDPLTGTDNSGFDAIRYDGYNVKKGGAQYLYLSAPQALAYVRSRDTLPGIDIGRTKRQQAVIDYVIYELKHRGVFGDLGLLNSLLGTASKYLITDSTFNSFDFAANMRALTGSHLSFTTLPISGQVNGMMLDGFSQDVNLINVPDIQRIVKNAFYPQPATGNPAAKAGGTKKATTAPAPSTVTVDVYNGNSGNSLATGLAGKFSRALAALGYKAGAITNSSAQSQTVKPATQVFYGAGASANAVKIATEIGTTATALTSLPAGHVEVLIGSTVTQVPAGLTSPSTSTASTQSTGAKIMGAQASGASAATNSPTPSPSSTAGADNGAAGGALTVAPNAPYGIPCVY
jgi:anionic cell wall polymer biosynthesis LytR-Cps2A-Psr (LCP) family protein